ncbi:sulfite exporter TauE/SafE family protein [Exilibacterium tricleocarpae]|uniref:Probable membrane transporter protein n=1 Tax=Exilibacterium tricleocarpae TaxID=2591008 RepID=A0A545TUW7_9GAMM|nr:sulfite exporter TauE/SafE family protein [Exilibacterium tricleocarpae]TQV80999.1 sulfite exporter TauE/SafE family protein [Exilibacterium tricleocarpae]
MALAVTDIVLLLGTGLLAGVINVLAGGGSNLTLPALMVLGMPADVANATNRVGVFLQSLVAVRGFRQYGKLASGDLVAILAPMLIGGAVGAASASVLPNWLLKPLLLGAMIAMALVILIRPAVIAPPPGTAALPVGGRPGAVAALFAAGFYGGFVQAGVGFILLAALAGSLRYDLVRANALKMLCTAVFTAVALVVFIARDQIAWVPGLVLAAGNMVGAYVAVKVAIGISQQTLKWFLLVMTVAVSLAALFTGH